MKFAQQIEILLLVLWWCYLILTIIEIFAILVTIGRVLPDVIHWVSNICCFGNKTTKQEVKGEKKAAQINVDSKDMTCGCCKKSYKR